MQHDAVDPSAKSRGVPRGCSALKLRQLSRRVSRHFDRVVAESGLKTTQYSLLSHVAVAGALRPGELAAAMDLDASTLTRNVQPLVAQGWLEVQPGDDARSRRVAITAAGREKRAEAQRAWKRAQLAFNARVGERTVAELHAMIDGLLERLNDDGAD